MSNLERIKGSIPPIVTPIRDGEVDYDAYRNLVEFQVSQGSHGVLVNGTTAEPSTLTTEERNRLVDVAVDTVAGKIPVVAATGSQSLAETEVLTAHAVDAGVDALLIVTPYYIRPPQRGLVEYYLKLARQHETPWMIYHIPGRTAVNVTLDSMKEIREKSPHFVGMKCDRMPRRIRRRLQDFRGTRGTFFSNDDHWRLRTDECRGESAPGNSC
jgi:4-hydroxy-tetrahydrodipicolinate synthase